MNPAFAEPYETIALITFAFVGLCIGSFLNVVIHRLPRGTSVVTPPSRCSGCGYELRWFDNVPVLSWALLRGRCRKCKSPISIRYPIVEILTMVVFLLHWWVFGWTVLMGVRVLFACALIALFAIDLEHHLLPDKITLPGIAVGLIFSIIVPPGIVEAILGAILGWGVLWGDRGRLLPLLGAGRHGRRRSEDAGDDRRVPGVEAGPRHARALVGDRLADRDGRDRGAPRRHEIRPAVRHLPGRRRAAGLTGGGSPGRLVRRPLSSNQIPSSKSQIPTTSKRPNPKPNSQLLKPR